ncbi:hypothetical protein PoB_007678500, partial [Plakobranchus ocellatus]
FEKGACSLLPKKRRMWTERNECAFLQRRGTQSMRFLRMRRHCDLLRDIVCSEELHGDCQENLDLKNE